MHSGSRRGMLQTAPHKGISEVRRRIVNQSGRLIEAGTPAPAQSAISAYSPIRADRRTDRRVDQCVALFSAESR